MGPTPIVEMALLRSPSPIMAPDNNNMVYRIRSYCFFFRARASPVKGDREKLALGGSAVTDYFRNREASLSLA